MKKAFGRERVSGYLEVDGRRIVNGYLEVDGRRIVNGNGEEVILSGWGLGNWLLCEGYMWLSRGAARFDRPRRIEAVIEELAGKKYADGFWKKFRDAYITEDDIQMMAEMGYNSVRVPLNARLFVEEGPGTRFLEEGFRLLDRVVDWCEKYRLYVFLDLHGAPGGQTGANIDDSVDDVCRLLLDQEQFDKGVALWVQLAQRYAGRWIVGGYDLLNEPIRPVRFEGDASQEHLVGRLEQFYRECIRAIRAVDTRHLVTLEGHHWATALDIFDGEPYDDKMVLHFHRYGCTPDIGSFRPYLEAAERLNVPLWLGETGENTLEWFSAMLPLAAKLNIGFNLWPWKKMDCLNSPCCVQPPADWHKLIDYAQGGPHPGYAEAQKILDAYLRNIRVENCNLNENITPFLYRTPGCTVRGTDFDELPGQGVSYQCLRPSEPTTEYRQNTGMTLYRRYPELEKRFSFDGDWRQYVLRLSAGDFACYSLYDVTLHSKLEIHCASDSASLLAVYQDERLLGRFSLSGLPETQIISGLRLQTADACVIRLAVESGQADVVALATETGA